MSSTNTVSNLEDTSVDRNGHENNDCDNVSKAESNSNTEQEKTACEVYSVHKKYLRIMLNLIKEILIMALVAITYAAFKNNPPKIGKSPTAYRFFPEDSHIADWYRGEISDAISQARSADIAFVMFYAPWDAECQHARKEFQKVAKYMHQEVTFAAVNCWQPGSECKTHYSKVNKWPILIAYPSHGRGVQYSGPLVAVHMMTFLKKLITPFTRTKDIFSLLAKHDVVVAAELYAGSDRREYVTFYETTLRLLERDPFQEIAVSVHTHSLYDEYGEENMAILSLHMWNETLFYPVDEEWTVESLLQWITKHVHQVTTWISPSGAKSLNLANYLQPGPALIFFTPKNPLAIHSDFHSMLREVSLEYNNCEGNPLTHIIQKTVRMERRAKYLEQLKITEECSMQNFKVQKIFSPNLWSNTSYCLEKRYQSESTYFSESNMVHYYGGINNLCLKLLQNIDEKTDISSKNCSEVNIQKILYKTSKLTDMPDSKSPENLKKNQKRETCRSFLIAQKYQPLVFSSELYSTEHVNISGLACKTNRTLSLISMDSLYYHHYAEKLGVDLSKMQDNAAVVILDDKMESHYIMSGALTESNLKSFIYNFTYNLLPRSMSSFTTVVSQNTHSYPNDKPCTSEAAKFCINEVSSINFLETISQENMAVVVFYYSKQCSFCNGISHRFLNVARYLSPVDDIQFVRIDGDLNLLPWEYTMDTYPTILFVPPNKKSESRVFPLDLPITEPNLIGFLLANLESALKLEVMWTLCENTKFTNTSDCYSSLRLQTSFVIDQILHRWRLSSTANDKSTALSIIYHFHELQTRFIQHPANYPSVKYHFNKLRLLRQTTKR